MKGRPFPSRIGTLVISLVATAVLLAGCGASSGLPEPVTIPDLEVFPNNAPSPLVMDAADLQELIVARDAGLVIVDVSSLARYRAGHILGAIHAWWQDSMDPNGPVYGTVLKPDENDPDPQALRRAFVEDLGVLPTDTIVIYDDASGLNASRMVWTLRFLGYGGAAILDGGLAAWLGAGHQLDTTTRTARPAPATVEIDPQGTQQSVYLGKDQLLSRLQDSNILIVDVRSSAQARDDIDSTIEPGTIPGALAIPWTVTVQPSGALKNGAELQGLFTDAGLTTDKTVILLARFGNEAAHTWLVLTLLGYPNVTILDGGWNEWALDPNTPKAPLPGA